LKKLFYSLLSLPFCLGALECQPWFGDVYEFHFLGSYAYSQFHKVQNGTPQLTHVFQSNLVYLGLDFSPSPEWSIDTDLQVADTTQESFYFRTWGLQGRYLWLDDIVGDPITLTTGANIRVMSTTSLHDVSSPYHGNVDFELNFALGKEFDAADTWRFRAWAYGAVGQANRGSPWVRAIVALETNIEDAHKLGLFALGSNGYGRHTTVLIDDFNGYAKIRQKSIDLAFRYGYRIGVWGTIRLEYQRRVLAKSCPQNVNTFILNYLLPFSL
jgi:hypothetical protein